MQLKFLLISSILGVLGAIKCIQAGAIEVIYTGDSCDCHKKLNYLVNRPIQPEPKDERPNEYGYNLQRPLNPRPRVTYSFDFMAEEPKKPIPPPEVKWDLFAKIDRITASKKDCFATEEEPKPCGCNRYAFANRYVSPESSAARYTRNLRHPNNIDTMAEPSEPTAQIMAIFLEPLKQTKAAISKSRNKRDISRIFMRPRKYEKRSDRMVKKYNKRLRDLAASEKTHFDNVQKPIRSRSIAVGGTEPARIRPLQQLRNFLAMPSLRNKRDIKGEYDMIEKEREQMDLTLPEIIQYMPETLKPNFKRNQCHFGQRCQHSEMSESTTKTTPTKGESETMTTMAASENKDTTPDTLSVTEANSLKDEKEEKHIDNSISTAHIKRNANDYTDGGCPLVSKGNNPTPNPTFTYEAIPGPVVTARNSYGLDPVPQQYVGSSYNPYTSAIIDNGPLLKASYAKPTVQQISHAQLDRIIASIVNKHSDFIEASSHAGGNLVDPPREQEEQAKYFLKHLGPWNDWSWSAGHYHRPYPKVHAYLRPYRVPVAEYVQ